MIQVTCMWHLGYTAEFAKLQLDPKNPGFLGISKLPVQKTICWCLQKSHYQIATARLGLNQCTTSSLHSHFEILHCFCSLMYNAC